MSTELNFINWLSKHTATSPEVLVGIGDDAALVGTSQDSWLIACDTLNDGTHFDTLIHSPELIGRKSLAVTLSDIAAMGGIPKFTVVGVSLPRNLGPQFAEKLYRGLQSLAGHMNVIVVGGDTTIWDKDLVITTTVMGKPHVKGVAKRSHGRPDDVIFVTGPLGGSLNKGRHFAFEPQVNLASYLMDHYAIRAMMDLSDGLGMDLPRIATASQCGFHLQADCVPIHADVPHGSPQKRFESALSDGEDFELLFTTDPQTAKAIQSDEFLVSQGIQRIGVLTKDPSQIYSWSNSQPRVLPQMGYEHQY